jgi:hypothetical protein
MALRKIQERWAAHRGYQDEGWFPMRLSARSILTSLLLWGGATFLLSGCALFFGAQGRYLIAEKNREEVPSHYESLTFTEFLALPPIPAHYTEQDWTIVRQESLRAVSLEGYIAEVRRIHDGPMYGDWPWEGDFHVHLRDRPQSQCTPPGPRNNQIVTEVTPHFQPPRTGWSEAALRDLCDRQVRVRISGWLLHDYEHADGVSRWRATPWEIHPVTRIEVWDLARRTWQVVP